MVLVSPRAVNSIHNPGFTFKVFQLRPSLNGVCHRVHLADWRQGKATTRKARRRSYPGFRAHFNPPCGTEEGTMPVSSEVRGSLWRRKKKKKKQKAHLSTVRKKKKRNENEKEEQVAYQPPSPTCYQLSTGFPMNHPIGLSPTPWRLKLD